MKVTLRSLYKRFGKRNTFFPPAKSGFHYYKFYKHLRHFIKFHSDKKNWFEIEKNLFQEVPSDSQSAWEARRKFRGAQAEVSATYLVEKMLGHEVIDFEVKSPYSITRKTVDQKLRVKGSEEFLEVKAQCGQQNGKNHPLSKKPIGYDPDSEEDTISWLYHDRISSRDGKIMKSKVTEAIEKGATILFAMIDCFRLDSNSFTEFVQLLFPNSAECGEMRFCENYRVHFFEEKSIIKPPLKEIWIFDDSHLHRLGVIFYDRSCLQPR